MQPTPKEIKDAIDAALETSDTLDNHELVITSAYMDQIEPGSTYKGLFVVLGKAVAVRPRTVAPVKTTLQPQDVSGPLCYWFKDRKGRVFNTDQRTAYRYVTQNAEWKYTPQYLGATSLKAYEEGMPTFEKMDRMTELMTISNEEGEKMRGPLQNELRLLINQSKQVVQEYNAAHVEGANPAMRPQGSDLVQVIAKGNDIRGNPEQIVRANMGLL